MKFDFIDDLLGVNMFPKQLRPLIPNKYAIPPSLFGTYDRYDIYSMYSSLIFWRIAVYMHSAVLLSTRPIIAGEELLLDYRLNPELSLPSWYILCNEEASKRRWR